MAKCRIGHFAEAQILEALGVDFVDESEVLTPADEEHHVDKYAFKVPFVCGCRNLGEALRRIGEGAAMIRTKGEAGHRQHRRGRAPHARRHGVESVGCQMLREDELMAEAKNLGAPYHVVLRGARDGQAARAQLRRRRHRHAGRRRADDAARRRDGVRRQRNLQERRSQPCGPRPSSQAVTYYEDPEKLAEISQDLGDAMRGQSVEKLSKDELLAGRGW